MQCNNCIVNVSLNTTNKIKVRCDNPISLIKNQIFAGHIIVE